MGVSEANSAATAPGTRIRKLYTPVMPASVAPSNAPRVRSSSSRASQLVRCRSLSGLPLNACRSTYENAGSSSSVTGRIWNVVAMLAFLPAVRERRQLLFRRPVGGLPTRRADLHACGDLGWPDDPARPAARDAPLTCTCAVPSAGRIQFGHHGCPCRGPSPTRRALRLALGERVGGTSAHHREPPGGPPAYRGDGVHQHRGRPRVAVLVLARPAHPAGAGRWPAAVAARAAHPVRADRHRP